MSYIGILLKIFRVHMVYILEVIQGSYGGISLNVRGIS